MTGFWDAPTVVVLTGASAAIGAEVSGLLSRALCRGSCLILTSRSQARLEALPLAKDRGVSLCLAEVDLSQPEKASFEKLLSQAPNPGTYSKAILIHNAAALGDMGRKVSDLDDKAELYEQLNVNLVSTILLTSTFLKKFGGSTRFVVNMTAPSAVSPRPSFGLTSMVKAPRQLMMKILALEDPDVKVLSFDPVAVDSHSLQTIRDSSHDPKIREWIKGFYDRSEVLPVEQVAAALIGFLEHQSYESGDVKRSVEFN